MHGSGCPRLLAIVFILFLPPAGFGQSDRLIQSPSIANPKLAPGSADQSPLPIPAPISAPIFPPIPAPILPRQPFPSRRKVPAPPFGLPQMVHAAGIIFSGTVMAIGHPPPHGPQIETVTITFHVEQAIRGATTGENLAVTQWMGLWSNGQSYRVGERVLVFLYPRSKLGLTSVVGGGMGRFAIDGQGRALLNGQHIVAFRNDPILSGKARANVGDFASAIRRASEEEPAP